LESLSSFVKYLQDYPDSLKERYGEIICNHGAVQKSLGQTPLDGLINIDKKVTVELQPDANGPRPIQHARYPNEDETWGVMFMAWDFPWFQRNLIYPGDLPCRYLLSQGFHKRPFLVK